jgi:hypothetical protein
MAKQELASPASFQTKSGLTMRKKPGMLDFGNATFPV